MKVTALILFVLVFIGGCNPFLKQVKDIPINRIEMPDGFEISIFAENVLDARSMTKGEQGTIFIGSRDEGNLYALYDNNNDQRADTTIIIASNLNTPNGVAFYQGDLYVAEPTQILKYKDIENHLTDNPTYEVIYDEFPDQDGHEWKYISIGPDGKLYVPVGAPCNICNREDEIYATITRMDTDGENFEIFAHGIRNSVGFDWHPVTGELWFTDNGRDWLGNNRPPDELNKATEKELHFGYPYCHGETIQDPEYGEDKDCGDFVQPQMNLSPHAAALGMLFYTGNMFPQQYQNKVLIAEHGSWNRTTPIGYRITQVGIENNQATNYEVFADGWLDEIRAWGRPVDLLQLDDGSLLVSDDFANIIYRVSYND